LAYADDLAVIIPDLKTIRSLAYVLMVFSDASGLKVKIEKSPILPTIPPTLEQQQEIKKSVWPPIGRPLGNPHRI